MQLTDFYFEKHSQNIVRIRYDEIILNPVKVINEIGEVINCVVGKERAETIADQHSRENVKKIIKSLEDVAISDSGDFQDSRQSSEFEAVKNLDGGFRIIDKKTRFQTNHITSKKEGEWREFLSEEQKEILMNTSSAWLNRYNFPL